MKSGGSNALATAGRCTGKERLRKARLSPVKRLNLEVEETLRSMASKVEDLNTNSIEKPFDTTIDGRSNDSEKPEESDVCYETEDFQLLESQLVVDAPTDASATRENGEAHPTLTPSLGKEELPWNARTSFTADSPYFDAFVSSELQCFNVLTETLNGIAAHTRAFVKQSAIMSDVAKRLSLACKLRSTDVSDDDTADSDGVAANLEEELIQQRRNAIGEEMAGILELLGEVRQYYVFAYCQFLFIAPSDMYFPFRFLKILPLHKSPCAKPWKRRWAYRLKRLLSRKLKRSPYCIEKPMRAQNPLSNYILSI
jgi:hypothetical protein